MSSLGPAETERNAGSPSDVPRTTNNVRLMLNLSALMSFASISTDMYLPALPAISRALHTDSAGVELTFSAFLIGFSLGQLIWGPISDRFGRKFPILIGMVLFIIGSVGCALSTTVTEMMVWRVVQALGACVGPVLSRAMVRDLYGREQSAKMLSTLILIMGVAPIAGPLVGGQILLLWSWPAIFWALAIVGLVTLFSFGRLPESLPPKHRTREPLRHTFATYLQLIRDPR
ncbi:Bcr/CflA family efflux MFS transporter, partial [Pseudomonas marginalis]|uniref:Bcr/CflA family efflux MFS transporter n=2 Tax=Pseudomonas TaxID=286 RepID=UPI001F1CC28B